ncbi:hypothetical protein LTR10_007005 [Elasticomyces elasticus]|nr:hypothetical protein LTR10_007005 [Elasticomyces elasticus]KAK4978823.1 hypothetical protein LTR42_001323 [Elasticomyces elasticus]
MAFNSFGGQHWPRTDGPVIKLESNSIAGVNVSSRAASTVAQLATHNWAQPASIITLCEHVMVNATLTWPILDSRRAHNDGTGRFHPARPTPAMSVAIGKGQNEALPFFAVITRNYMDERGSQRSAPQMLYLQSEDSDSVESALQKLLSLTKSILLEQAPTTSPVNRQAKLVAVAGHGGYYIPEVGNGCDNQSCPNEMGGSVQAGRTLG